MVLNLRSSRREVAPLVLPLLHALPPSQVRRLLDLQLVEGESRTVVHLDTYLAAQKSFMNTRHPDFGLERQPRQDSLVKIPNKIFEEAREQKQVPAGTQGGLAGTLVYLVVMMFFFADLQIYQTVRQKSGEAL